MYEKSKLYMTRQHYLGLVIEQIVWSYNLIFNVRYCEQRIYSLVAIVRALFDRLKKKGTR